VPGRGLRSRTEARHGIGEPTWHHFGSRGRRWRTSTQRIRQTGPIKRIKSINGASLNFQEKETGSIEVGKFADLVVLDKNLFKIPKHQIHQAKVLGTFLEGVEVYCGLETGDRPDSR
jgi:cytosine/adenosine deaminase-related metal-dependent hydrolase